MKNNFKSHEIFNLHSSLWINYYKFMMLIFILTEVRWHQSFTTYFRKCFYLTFLHFFVFRSTVDYLMLVAMKKSPSSFGYSSVPLFISWDFFQSKTHQAARGIGRRNIDLGQLVSQAKVWVFILFVFFVSFETICCHIDNKILKVHKQKDSWWWSQFEKKFGNRMETVRVGTVLQG